MRKISVCIVLSLVMCLCMAFPVSAMDYNPDIDSLVASVVSSVDAFASTKKPSNYKYRFVGTSNKLAVKSFRIFYSSTPVISAGSHIYVFSCFEATSYTPVMETFQNGHYNIHSIVAYTNSVQFTFYTGTAVVSGYGFGQYIKNYSTATLSDSNFLLLRSALDYDCILSTLNPPVDTSALQSLVNTAKSTSDTGYTPDSWQALQAQITSAEILLNTTGYTQSQVDSQTAALQSALDGLVLAPVLPDTTELQELLFEADKITDIGYTEPTWTRFSNARMAGHNLLARPTYTALDVQTATDELRSSMSGLTLASVNPPVNPPVKPPQDYPATTFESFLGSERAATYLDVSEGFSLAHLFPAVAGIEENMSEARKFAIWVFVAILGVYITTRILRTVVFVDSVDATGGHEKIFNIGMNDAKRSALASRDDLTKKERASLGSEYQGTYLRQVNIGEKYIDW